MARPIKTGLDYFPLDVHIDDSIELLEAECGLEGYAILIKLWQKIYSEGYYIEWNADTALLFSRKIATDAELVNNVIRVCTNRDIFSKTLFTKYSILTSSGIQKRYLYACYQSKRKAITMITQYKLVAEPYDEYITDEIELITEETPITDGSMTEETPVKESNTLEESTQRKEKERKADIYIADSEYLWGLYPEKKGKPTAMGKMPKLIEKYGKDQIERSIQRYIKYVDKKRKNGFPELNYKNGSTFFNNGYADYLDENYQEKTKPHREPLKAIIVKARSASDE